MKLTYRNIQLQYVLDFVVEHCILAVAFFLPLSLEIANVFFIVGVVAWCGKMVAQRQINLVKTPFDEIIALLIIFSAASLWNSPDRGFSLYNYTHLMGRYLLIYYFAVNNIHSLEQVKRLVWAVLASSVVVAGYGFYQYLFGASISAEWVDNEQFPDLKMRVFSTLENPNLLGGFLVTVMSLAGGIACKYGNRRTKLVLFGLVVMLALCLGMTYSRGAWLSLLVVIVTYGFLYSRKIFWLLLVIPVVIFFAHDAVMERLMSIMNPTDTSSTLRLALWESTVAMIMDKPLLGIGWGAYWMVYPDYDFFINNASTRIVHAHNMYLNIAAEIGIPGLFTFLAIIYGHVKSALMVYSCVEDRWMSGFMLGFTTAMVGLLVNGFTDYIMFNIQMSMLFWLLNGIVAITRQKTCMYESKKYFTKKM